MKPVSALGVTQILAWGSSFYLPAVLAKPISDDTGWPFAWVIGGLSLALLVAGLAARRVGRTIDRHGGRPVLMGSSLLFAVGLAGLAVSPSLPFYLAAWLIVGLGMGGGLYDAAFSTLGRLHGDAARASITALTLWGGFASTVCWPLSAYLVETAGWRETCLVYAALHLGVGLPIHAFALPRERHDAAPLRSAPTTADGSPIAGRASVFPVLATLITIGSAIVSIFGVHLLTILQARDIALATAVALGALVGPSQVGARFIEMLFGRHYHPIWTMAASTVLMAGGMAIFTASLPMVAVGIVVYAAGVGIQSIARGTLPLALFGASGYAVVMGRLAMPALIAQSVSPTLVAFMLERAGTATTLAALVALAAANVALVAMLWRLTRQKR